MTQRGFPFDAGEGLAYELDWSLMARNWLSSGVIDGQLNELLVYGDSSGMQVKIPTGHAWIRGHYYKNDAEIIQAISASDPTNPRIDRVVLRIDYDANTIRAAVLVGTPAGSPVAPALTQNDTIYELLLVNIAVGAGVGLIAAGNVTDLRAFANVVIPAASIVNAMIANGAITSWLIADGHVTLAKLDANSVNASKIVDGSVGVAELASNIPGRNLPKMWAFSFH